MKLAPGKLKMDNLEKRSPQELAFLVLNLQEQVNALQKENLEKDIMIANLKEINKMRLIERYKPSSEQMASLFDEVELYDLAQSTLVEDEKIKVEGYEKTRKKNEISFLPSNTPVYDVYHTDDATDKYTGKDGIEYIREKEDEVVNKIAYVPKRIVIERHHYPKYRAFCETENNKGTEVKLRNDVIDKIAASPSFISYIAVSKYDDHLPLYRISEILARSGIKISSQKMAAWLIKYMEALITFSQFWDKKVFHQTFLEMDESPVKILDVTNKEGRPSSNCFMVFRRGSSYIAEERITHVLISYKASIGRTKDELLEEYRNEKFSGYVMTDGLTSYKDIEHHCSCWVHAARPFKKMLKDNPKAENPKIITMNIASLFKIDETWRRKLLSGEINEKTFLEGRKKESLIIINEIFSFCSTLMLKTTPESPMGMALSYIITRKDILPGYLEAVEATPSNNEAERCAKAFATGRMNWVFSKAIQSGYIYYFYYSIIESAKANGLDPLLYTELICTRGPYCKSEEEMESLLPWNADLSEVKDMVSLRCKATADQSRNKPYLLTGLRG